jgi:hypothetical protein
MASSRATVSKSSESINAVTSRSSEKSRLSLTEQTSNKRKLTWLETNDDNDNDNDNGEEEKFEPHEIEKGDPCDISSCTNIDRYKTFGNCSHCTKKCCEEHWIGSSQGTNPICNTCHAGRVERCDNAQGCVKCCMDICLEPGVICCITCKKMACGLHFDRYGKCDSCVYIEKKSILDKECVIICETTGRHRCTTCKNENKACKLVMNDRPPGDVCNMCYIDYGSRITSVKSHINNKRSRKNIIQRESKASDFKLDKLKVKESEAKVDESKVDSKVEAKQKKQKKPKKPKKPIIYSCEVCLINNGGGCGGIIGDVCGFCRKSACSKCLEVGKSIDDDDDDDDDDTDTNTKSGQDDIILLACQECRWYGKCGPPASLINPLKIMKSLQSCDQCKMQRPTNELSKCDACKLTKVCNYCTIFCQAKGCKNLICFRCTDPSKSYHCEKHAISGALLVLRKKIESHFSEPLEDKGIVKWMNGIKWRVDLSDHGQIYIYDERYHGDNILDTTFSWKVLGEGLSQTINSKASNIGVKLCVTGGYCYILFTDDEVTSIPKLSSP